MRCASHHSSSPGRRSFSRNSWSASVADRDFKRTLRIFALGIACGFIVGAALVAVLITKYGQVAGVQPASRVAVNDGLADVDAPVLDTRRPAPAAPDATTGTETSVAAAPPGGLARRDLEMPVEGVRPDQLVRSFED